MKIRKLCICGLFAALMAVCAWLCLPFGNMVFTLQTFGLFLTLGLLGGKWGSLSVFVYLLLGFVGLPVFSGFRGGVGMLLNPTGGYLLGFLAATLVYWGIFHLTKRMLPAMVSGLLGCYLFGSFWYALFYLPGSGVWGAISVCVLPYLLPDAAKLLFALFLTRRLKRFVY